MNKFEKDLKELEEKVNKIELYINQIDNALELAERYESDIDLGILNLPGMSGFKTRHFLNNLVRNVPGRYLEVGVFAGSTFCSALNKATNKNYSMAIDNWSEFGGPKSSFFRNVQNYIDVENQKIGFIEKDCWQITEQDLRIKKMGKFSTYLFDGPHKFIDQKNALTKYIDFLEDDFIFLCDDWNWTEDVEAGTRSAIEELELKVHKEWVMKTPNNIDNDRAGWWNGYFAMVASKKSI